jgi:dipeptidyl aminopeptidase/acylaminoacyl peptidase
VANNFSFIDPERVAVTGVSYGGYVAGLMLADRAKDVLACGVAVTPVVDWRFYGKLF